MAALIFPSAPVDGEVFSAPNGIVYRWDAAAGLWLVWGTGTNNAIIGSTPPADPVAGQLWWSDVLGQLFIWFAGQWVPASPTPTLLNPPGLIADFGGLVEPVGWYFCDGALKSRTEDAPLFVAISTLYGEGDGETTFALPDLRGRVTAMADGGAGRLPDWTVGLAGGEAAHVLGYNEMPVHDHGVHDPSHAHDALAGAFVTAAAGQYFWAPLYTPGGDLASYYVNTTSWNVTGIAIYNAGASWAHNNVQPTMTVNKIIKR